MGRVDDRLAELGLELPPPLVPQAAYQSARDTALSMLASLRREFGDLDRITGWQPIHGMVNADAGYTGARTAVGMATLPLDQCVVVAAEPEIDG